MVANRIKENNILEGFSNDFIYLATASIVGFAIYLEFSGSKLATKSKGQPFRAGFISIQHLPCKESFFEIPE